MQYRETSRLFDQVGITDDYRSELNKMLDLMRMLISEKREMAHQLEQTHQQICELTHQLEKMTHERDTNTIELTNLLKQVIQERNDLARQLEQAYQQIHGLTHKLEKMTRERDNLKDTTRELTNRWKQTIRERDDLACQLKQACFEGETSSPSANLEELTYESIRDWFVRECLN